jgi:two-component system response regulator TctD
MKFFVISDDSFDPLWLCDNRSNVTQVAAPDEAIAILAGETFDVVIVDVVSSSSAKLDFIRRRREMVGRTPLLALTGCRNEDRLRALGLGADDAVTQPVDAGELRVRCAALVRRKNGQSRSIVQYGGLSLLLESREVWYQKHPVFLTTMEYSVLEILAIRQGSLATIDAIMKRLYGGVDQPAKRILGVFIANLRKKLREVGADRLIANVHGHGYQLRKLGEAFPPPPGASSVDTCTDSDRCDRPAAL